MQRVRPALLVLCLVGAATIGLACDEPYDNVETCTDYLLAVDCGDYITEDYAITTCETYADLECDLSEFFDCAAQHVGCTDDGYFTGLDAAYEACAAKASCL